MRFSSRAVGLGALVAAASLTAPSAFAAGPRLLPAKQVRVSADQAVRQACATRSITGAGVARRGFTAAADGYVTARLSGPVSSDWDLAVVDKATGNLLKGAAALGSDEIATTRVRRGQELLVQSCRRSGAASSVELNVQFTEATLGSPASKVVLVRVNLGSQFERFKLSSLQLDTTDHPAPSYQDVLLHSAGEEATLRRAGFSFQVRNADVLASDRAARRAEQVAGRSAKARAAARAATPSGRTSYRTLPEHEQELKDLAAANPGLVRVFELAHRSIEGRPITGIEIAENVDNPPDGRPPTSRWARTTPASGRPTRRRSSSAAS